MEPLKEYGATELSLDNPIVPTERLLNTPSSKDGCSSELEVDLRIVGCEYIQSAGMLLRLPQVAMATAQVLFQRFYYSKSFVKYSIQPLAMASIFLAAKIEENFRRLREVINVFHHLKQKKLGRTLSPMDYMGEEYFKTKGTVIKYERFLLRELGFCVHIKHAHKLVVTYLSMLGLEQASLIQRAWNNVNDSLRTNVFVRFTPETIACAAIFLAARQLKVSLPLRPPWWQLFGVEKKDLEVISLELLALYSRPVKMLDILEKEVSALREKLAKKVEIKEVNLKKVDSTASSPGSADGDKTSSSKSPLSVPALQATKPSSSNPSPLTLSRKEPIKNGRSSSLEAASRKRSRSPDTKATSDPSKSISTVTKVISAPLTLSSSDSEGDQRGSVSPQYNGVPERYRQDLERDIQVRKSKHKHRSDKHSDHYSRHSRPKHRSHDNEHRSHDNERRQVYYNDKERESKSHHRKRDRDYERDYYSSSSKIRKSEYVRHR